MRYSDIIQSSKFNIPDWDIESQHHHVAVFENDFKQVYVYLSNGKVYVMEQDGTTSMLPSFPALKTWLLDHDFTANQIAIMKLTEE